MARRRSGYFMPPGGMREFTAGGWRRSQMPIVLEVNGERYELDVPPDRRLAEVLRQELGLTGTKIACGEGACGACAVLVDGRAVASCIKTVAAVEGHSVLTVEGLSRN